MEGLAGILGEPGTGCLTRATGCEGRAQTSSDQPAHSWSGGFFDFRFRFTTTTTTAAAAAAAATMMTFIGPPSGARSIRRIGSSRNEPDGRAARKENDTLWLSRKRLKVHEEEAKGSGPAVYSVSSRTCRAGSARTYAAKASLNREPGRRSRRWASACWPVIPEDRVRGLRDPGVDGSLHVHDSVDRQSAEHPPVLDFTGHEERLVLVDGDELHGRPAISLPSRHGDGKATRCTCCTCPLRRVPPSSSATRARCRRT